MACLQPVNTEDICVLQIAGSRRWELCGPPRSSISERNAPLHRLHEVSRFSMRMYAWVIFFLFQRDIGIAARMGQDGPCTCVLCSSRRAV